MKNPGVCIVVLFVMVMTGMFAAAVTQAQAATNSPNITLTIFGAGTLAAPFKQIDNAFMKQYSNVKIQAQFGGSVKMVKQVTELHQIADVIAVADCGKG